MNKSSLIRVLLAGLWKCHAGKWRWKGFCIHLTPCTLKIIILPGLSIWWLKYLNIQSFCHDFKKVTRFVCLFCFFDFLFCFVNFNCLFALGDLNEFLRLVKIWWFIMDFYFFFSFLFIVIYSGSRGLLIVLKIQNFFIFQFYK